MDDWNRLVDAWKATLVAIERLGGHTTLQSARRAGIRHSKMWGLDIVAPATEADVERVEGQLGIGLPVALRHIFLQRARSIDLRWQLPKDFILPPAFRELFSGGSSVSLDALPDHENLRGEMVEDCFHNSHDPCDAVWHHKLAVIDVPNGDYIGIDLRAGHHGEVVYLSHDDGEGHSYARSRLHRFSPPLGAARLPWTRGLAMAALRLRQDVDAGPGRRDGPEMAGDAGPR